MKKTFSFLFLILFLQTLCFAAKFSFAVFGDNRDGEETFRSLLAGIKSDDSIVFAVNTGDFTSRGLASEYEDYWKICKASGVKIYDAIGNHDLGFFNQGTAVFRKKYGETYYYFDYDNARFIILDNTKAKGMGRVQLVWLKDALDTDKMIFVFMHKPLFDPTGTYPNYVMIPKSENEALNQLLKINKVGYIFAGHIHGYGREEQNGIVYLVTAGAGAPLYLPHFNGGFYHYVKVTVDGSNVKDEIVKIYND